MKSIIEGVARKSQNEITEALFILKARDKETLADVAKRRMLEAGKTPGDVPPVRASQMEDFASNT